MSLLQLLALVQKYGPLLKDLGPRVTELIALIKEIVTAFKNDVPPRVGAETDITKEDFVLQSGLDHTSAESLIEALQ